ncbi:MAG: hypothetical protein U1D30_12570 [Planctomycetota bacterium]
MNVIKPVISETSESRVSEAKQETYYMVLFASQTPVWRKPKAHCFASFVRVPAAGEDGEREEPEIHTISWYPAAGRCRVIHPPEEGVNSALDITIERCKKARMNLYKWGPVQIKKEFYDKAVLRASQLHAGELRWQALDKSTRRQGVAVNCIHALSDLDIENGYVEFGLCSGRSAAEQMARMFSKWVISPETATTLFSILNLPSRNHGLGTVTSSLANVPAYLLFCCALFR